jgi:hypothetical protein
MALTLASSVVPASAEASMSILTETVIAVLAAAENIWSAEKPNAEGSGEREQGQTGSGGKQGQLLFVYTKSDLQARW